jgi:hypothetical protein
MINESSKKILREIKQIRYTYDLEPINNPEIIEYALLNYLRKLKEDVNNVRKC